MVVNYKQGDDCRDRGNMGGTGTNNDRIYMERKDFFDQSTIGRQQTGFLVTVGLDKRANGVTNDS